MPPSPAKKSLWSEYTNSEGRKYWSHATTKQSVWEKPDELKTPFERALAKTQWKQYTSKDRPYYVNTVTKETKWDLPAELKELKEKLDREEQRRAQGLGSPDRSSRSPTPEDIRELREAAANAIAPYGKLPPSSTDSPARIEARATPKVPIGEVIIMPPGGFAEKSKAEEAFIYLLKREGINEQWTWDQTMRKIIMDPLYKALDTLAEKKGAFEKHINSILDTRRQAKQLRISKLRPIFHKLFSNSAEIKSYSTMKTADQVFANNKYWREAQFDERALILDEYVDDLRRMEESSERALRDRNLKTLSELIRTLDISVSTRWRAAHDLIVSSETFKEDTDLQKIETVDMIQVYDVYSRQLEMEHEEESKRLRIENIRKARKAREGFKLLLTELQDQGHFNRLTKFKEIYPKIKVDERYNALLGLQGSNPLDLFMDHIDDLNEEVERSAEKLQRALSKEEKEIKLETTFDELETWIKDAKIENQFEGRVRKEVYDLIHGKLQQAAEDEQRRAERRRRHRIDDLRYALKKVGRHIDLEMTYEEALPHMQDLPEFKEVSEEEDRKAAFDKFVKRQKEKLREAESSEQGSTRDRDRDRERDREDRHDRDRHREKDRSDRDREKDRRYSSTREKEKDRDEGMDVDEKEYRSSRKDREREKDRDRDRDRKESHKERDRDRDRDREKKRGSVGPEDKDRERESKRRRMSSSSHKKEKDEVEEGEI
ncbi:uncharacterized protein I303_106815 [Kwoniella dejecticola CBS 10117]|uniref:Pre-mRNA-processing factor 40 n=1 Tax=Kwoniella dejecticola CBS 10117 TaxID=1296121 RepID=A0A1A5ZTK9_9TREE|nr:pre-mRNA-processing factor 40 [Kwoniella dejecticola CBS 10117]OBR81158.1 pre-mRNA-processing factor 40 [Kwoniella dejecticola CBS 10117]